MKTPIGSSFAWSRREAIRALAGAAVLPALSPAAEPGRRVGIIGGGMAGVSLAWLLNGAVDVVLLEGRASLGGNVQSVAVELDGHGGAKARGAKGNRRIRRAPATNGPRPGEYIGPTPPASGSIRTAASR